MAELEPLGEWRFTEDQAEFVALAMRCRLPGRVTLMLLLTKLIWYKLFMQPVTLIYKANLCTLCSWGTTIGDCHR